MTDVHGALYSSRVTFPGRCSDDEFARARPLIDRQLRSLDAVPADVLCERATALMPARFNPTAYSSYALVAVSAHVVASKVPEPYLLLDYGDDEVRLRAHFRDGTIFDVEPDVV